MALETDSLNKRTLGPAIGSAVVGIALGVITIIGIAQFSGTDTVPEGNAVSASDAVLGGPEYGSCKIRPMAISFPRVHSSF